MGILKFINFETIDAGAFEVIGFVLVEGYVLFWDCWGKGHGVLARIETGAQSQVQASLTLIEHVDLGNLRTISIKSITDNHFEFLAKLTQLISIRTALVWWFRMAIASCDIWRSYTWTMIRHIAKRSDLLPLWRWIILHIIIRLLRRVKNNRLSLSLPSLSLHGTQCRDSTRNLFDTI